MSITVIVGIAGAVYRVRPLSGLRGVPMPRAKKSEPKQERVWHGFVRCELTEKEKADFKAWDVGFDEAFAELAELLPDYKLSLSYNKANQCYVASLTGTSPDHVNQGWCLSAFAGTLDNAVRVLWFKHLCVLQNDWTRDTIKRDYADIG